MRPFISLVVVLAATQLAGAGPMQITEWMYQGANGEFVEFTNTGSTPVDMTGWSYDDDSAVPGTIS
ncbi:MAG TPA: lamin tail domain-containing protein, partial [Phycisphaerae bacterium]|nr:lamin tail domain-containing protein [Phycisphaerae bacterium]